MVRQWVLRNVLVAYILLAYGLTWLMATPLVLSYYGIITTGFPFPLHFLLPFGPMLGALVVTWLERGTDGLREILGRMSRWRVRPVWIAVALFSVWALYIVSGAIIVMMDQPWPDVGLFGQVMYLPYLTFVGAWALWVFTYGIGEETGWRGFLLPRLQSKYSALTSALITGPIWAGWHVPMFLYNENLMSLGPIGIIFWVIGLMFGSVLLTWLYNSSKGSILMVAMWHGTYNLFTAAVGQAAGLTAGIISMFVMVLVLLIVIVYRPQNLSRSERQTVS
ncbi:MAG: CPBP family intramembrane metalloprotease [Candidatus Thorarchaeota archaeon]|nr:MAG: CPBP family intramembrane metalloprotease [Candidatus Thorarchaeota archaeon]